MPSLASSGPADDQKAIKILLAIVEIWSSGLLHRPHSLVSVRIRKNTNDLRSPDQRKNNEIMILKETRLKAPITAGCILFCFFVCR